jgi:hypothetical protein
MFRKLPSPSDVRKLQQAGVDAMKQIMKRPVRNDIRRVVQDYQKVARLPVKSPRR